MINGNHSQLTTNQLALLGSGFACWANVRNFNKVALSLKTPVTVVVARKTSRPE